MIEIAYTSRATHLMSALELEEMLRQAREFNRQNDITGMLLYKDGSFFQVIEGKGEVVETLYLSIQQDLRHFNVKTLYQRPLVQRNFPNWQMGFFSLNENADQVEKLNTVPGYFPFDLSDQLLDQWIQTSTAKLLIQSFRQFA